MRPVVGTRAQADACSPWNGGDGCRYNFPNPGIGGPPFRGPRPPFPVRGAVGPHGGRFFPPHGPRLPQMFQGGPPFPWAGQMAQPWRPPFRPVLGPRCTQLFSRGHSGAPTTSMRADGDNPNVEHPQHVVSECRSNTSKRTQHTGSQSVRDTENRCSTSGRVKTDAKREMREPRKRSRNNEYRRARWRRSRSSSSSRGNRSRERRRSRESKYAAKSRDDRKERKRARTRSCSPYEPRRQKRAECRSRARATSRCTRNARGERKRSTESTARMCIFPQSMKSAVAEPQETAERSAGTPRVADGNENARYSVAASSKKDAPRKEDFVDNESTSSKKEAMPATPEVTPPQVSVTISPGCSRVGSRGERDEEEEGLGSQVAGEGGDNLVKPFVGPSIEHKNQTPCSESQPGRASPDSTATLLQLGHTSLRDPSEVIRAEGEKNELAVTSREESAPTASVESNGEGVDPEATLSEDAVGGNISIGSTESVETSALPRGSRCPPSDLGQHIKRETDQVDGAGKHLAFSSAAENRCVKVEGEAESSGTLTPAHSSNDSSGVILPPELLAMLQKTGADTREALIQWFKSLTTPNNAYCVLKDRCERQEPLADFGSSTEAPQEQPADTGVSTQAPMCINVQMPRTSAATCVNLEAPSTSRNAYFRVDVDPDAETQSIASTPTLHDDVLEVSSSSEAPEEFDPQEDCYFSCTQGLSAPPGSIFPSLECSLPQMRPRINAAAFPALASIEEKLLYEADTQTAFLILDLLRDAQRKIQVQSLSEEGRNSDQRAACSAKIRRIVFDALENQPASRRSFVRRLRKLANFQWATNVLP